MAAVSDYRALLSGLSWYQAELGNKPAFVTYSFGAAPASYLAKELPTYATQFSPLTEWERGEVRRALGEWQAVAGVTFVEVQRSIGDINFSVIDLTATGSVQAAGRGSYPSPFSFKAADGKASAYGGDYLSGGDVWFDVGYRTNSQFQADFHHVALHEIGHALGLKHPFDQVGTHTETLSPDPVGSTVMSYSYRADALGPLDIAAAQYLYGGPGSKGNWSWDANAERLTVTGTAGDDLLRGTTSADVIYSLGGSDIINTSLGNDVVYLSGGRSTVKSGDGIDVVHTGVAIAALSSLNGSGDWRYFSTAAVSQSYEKTEYLYFTNAMVSVQPNVLVALDKHNLTVSAYQKLTRQDAAVGRLEDASVAIQTKAKTFAGFVSETIAKEAQDTTLPAVVVYKAMAGAAPVDAAMKSLSDFVYGQIHSAGYQATNDPVLGGYEAMGLALAKLSGFAAKAALKDDGSFVSTAYLDAFGRAAAAPQINHFVGQLTYFERLYQGVGIALGEAETQARGAVYGQMLGYAAREAGNTVKTAGETTLVGFVSTEMTAGAGWLV